MKLIIDIPDEMYDCIKKDTESEMYIIDVIKKGIPYEPKGDCISREALRKEYHKLKVWVNGDDEYVKQYEVDFLIDNAPTVEPCYQTTSCLDCGNYDKENHNCPRYCEVIKEAINSRPQGEWYYNYQNGWHCSICHEPVKDMPTVMGKANFAFCPNCGADMRKGIAE